MNKVLILLFTFLSFNSFSQETLNEAMVRVSKDLKQVESELTREEFRYVKYAIRDIEDILSNYDVSSPVDTSVKLTCLSNGKTGFYEKFIIFNITNNKEIGTYTSKESCEASIEDVMENNITCVSNGKAGFHEKFQISNVVTEKVFGEFTEKNSCTNSLKIITKDGFTCVSNGKVGFYEKFQLSNVITDKIIGTWVSKESCETSLGSF